MVTVVIMAAEHMISQLDHDAETAVDNLLCGRHKTLRRNFVDDLNYSCPIQH